MYNHIKHVHEQNLELEKTSHCGNKMINFYMVKTEQKTIDQMQNRNMDKFTSCKVKYEGKPTKCKAETARLHQM